MENNTVYPIRNIGKYPQIYVRSENPKMIEISFHFLKDVDGFAVRLTRLEARLLARRITSCLLESR